MRKPLAALCLATALAAPVATAQEDSLDRREREAIELVERMGFRPVSTRLINRTISRFSEANPQVPRKFWGDVFKALDSDSPLLNEIAGVYRNLFSPEEIRELRSFYSTPTGEKLARLLVVLSEQSSEASGRASQQIERRIRRSLEAAGYIQ